MKQFLTFAMVAPIASFGDIAVGERRDSRDHPARSAILGLVGACLGIEREDEEAHQSLEKDYGVAVLSCAVGKSLVDYHTAQSAPSERGEVFATRKQELEADNVATVLSRREYRTDIWHLGALWLREDAAPWQVDTIQDAMKAPHFAPYLGRRSCPLSFPLNPVIIEAGSVGEALLSRYEGQNNAEKEVKFRKEIFPKLRSTRLYLDRKDKQEIENSKEAGFIAHRRDMRRDVLLSRKRWQFGLREEVVLSYDHRKGEE